MSGGVSCQRSPLQHSLSCVREWCDDKTQYTWTARRDLAYHGRALIYVGKNTDVHAMYISKKRARPWPNPDASVYHSFPVAQMQVCRGRPTIKKVLKWCCVTCCFQSVESVPRISTVCFACSLSACCEIFTNCICLLGLYSNISVRFALQILSVLPLHSVE
jgi:hypothetical protein